MYLQIRETRDEEERQRNYNYEEKEWEERATMAFSILCMVLTVIYFGFAALTFSFANGVMEETDEDEREEVMLSARNNTANPHHFAGYNGYIGERLDFGRPRSDFAPPGRTLA